MEETFETRRGTRVVSRWHRVHWRSAEGRGPFDVPEGCLDGGHPKKLFNARLDGNTVRAIDFAEGAKVPAAALKALVREAVRQNN